MPAAGENSVLAGAAMMQEAVCRDMAGETVVPYLATQITVQPEGEFRLMLAR